MKKKSQNLEAALAVGVQPAGHQRPRHVHHCLFDHEHLGFRAEGFSRERGGRGGRERGVKRARVCEREADKGRHRDRDVMPFASAAGACLGLRVYDCLCWFFFSLVEQASFKEKPKIADSRVMPDP